MAGDNWDPLKITKPTHPEFLAAEARAKDLTEKAFANEAIRIITALEDEVKTMHISNRFSAVKEPNGDMISGGSLIKDVYEIMTGRTLTEAEHKRQTILNNLKRIKQAIISNVHDLREVVMEIEASKIDDIVPGQEEK